MSSFKHCKKKNVPTPKDKEARKRRWSPSIFIPFFKHSFWVHKVPRCTRINTVVAIGISLLGSMVVNRFFCLFEDVPDEPLHDLGRFLQHLRIGRILCIKRREASFQTCHLSHVINEFTWTKSNREKHGTDFCEHGISASADLYYHHRGKLWSSKSFTGGYQSVLAERLLVLVSNFNFLYIL